MTTTGEHSRVSLLDVNVLIAMSWPSHEFHLAVRQWLHNNRSHGWATSPLTQSGFVRVSAQAALKLAHGLEHAIRLLEKNCAEPDHVFWAEDSATTALLPEIRAGLMGHQQLSDAMLLDLAIRKGGRLVTLDRRIERLLPQTSLYRSSILVIPTGSGDPTGS